MNPIREVEVSDAMLAYIAPQVFFNGRPIGGLEDLEKWAKKAA